MTAAVVFDLDGTLVDSAPDMHTALNGVLAARGHAPLSLARVRGFIGAGVPTLIRRAMAAVGAAEDGFGDWHDAYMAGYADGICVATRPYDGVLDALDMLAARGYRLGICTNKPQGLSDALLDRLGLTPRFGAIIGGDTRLGRKPDPRPLFEVVTRLGGGGAVMVGDSTADLGAARAAGLPVLLFSGGYGGASLDLTAADGAFGDWADLPALVTGLLPASATPKPGK